VSVGVLCQVVLPPVGGKDRGGAGAGSSTKGGARAGPVIVGSVGHASASVFFLSQQPAGPTTLTGAYTSSAPPVLQVRTTLPCTPVSTCTGEQSKHCGCKQEGQGGRRVIV
jgi:hypothetical protein